MILHAFYRAFKVTGIKTNVERGAAGDESRDLQCNLTAVKGVAKWN